MKTIYVIFATFLFASSMWFMFGTYNSPRAEYQLNVYNDSTVIMDGNRVVGVMKYDSTSQFDKIINLDNL